MYPAPGLRSSKAHRSAAAETHTSCPCGEENCRGRHHRLLHGSSRVFPSKADVLTRRTVAATTPQKNEATLLQIVPFRVRVQIFRTKKGRFESKFVNVKAMGKSTVFQRVSRANPAPQRLQTQETGKAHGSDLLSAVGPTARRGSSGGAAGAGPPPPAR